MKAKFLFPSIFRPIGLLMALAGFTLGYFVLYHGYQIIFLGFGANRGSTTDFFHVPMNLTDEFAITLSIAGLLFIGFSRWETEDELTARLRLDALHWAVFIHTLLLLIAFIINNAIVQPVMAPGRLFSPWTIFSDAGWIIYTLFTPLIILIARLWYLRTQLEKGKVLKINLLSLPEKPFQWLGIIGGLISLILLALALAEPQWPILSDYINESVISLVWYLFPVFLLCWLFSRNKKEDEHREQQRLESWQLALYTHYWVILVLIYTVYGLNYLAILFIFVPYLLPVLFILIYNIRKLQTAAMQTYEKYN